MKREIKFRVWDTETKDFHISKLDDYGETSGGFPIIGYAGSMRGKSILQQFTGLLDKNGKEVYEGDLVKYKFEAFGHGSVVRYAGLGEVFFDSDTASFRIRGKKRIEEFCIGLKTEVVGNIYGNQYRKPFLCAE